jgi:hypothetical protein
MNREHYKIDRHKPKRNSPITRSKNQMLAKPIGINSTATPKLREIYSTRIEWATKIIPKLKEK